MCNKVSVRSHLFGADCLVLHIKAGAVVSATGQTHPRDWWVARGGEVRDWIRGHAEDQIAEVGGVSVLPRRLGWLHLAYPATYPWLTLSTARPEWCVALVFRSGSITIPEVLRPLPGWVGRIDVLIARAVAARLHFYSASFSRWKLGEGDERSVLSFSSSSALSGNPDRA